MLTVGQCRSKLQRDFLAVIQVALEKLGVHCVDSHILIIAYHPDVCQMLCIFKGNCVIMLCRREVCVHGHVTLLLAALTTAKGQFRQPVAHIRKINGNGAVCHILQLKIIGNVVIGILGRHIVVSFAGNQCVLIPVLGRGFSVSSKRHDHTIAIDHLNGNFLIGNKG